MTQRAESVAEVLGGALVDATTVDVGAARERARQRRLVILGVLLGVPTAFLWSRIVGGAPFDVFALPAVEDPFLYILPLAIVLALGGAVALPMIAGRSPHVLVRPEQIDVRFADVKGLDGVVEEVTKTLNTFLGYAMFRGRLGGNPRRGLLFEGPPGTGKTHVAKAMAAEAGVPFLFVSATSFQSMYYGATARKIRSYFKALRRVAAREGGAIGFIEEIDAIATTRGGMSATPYDGVAAVRSVQTRFTSSEGAGGVVNELLVQLQSFDTPPLLHRLLNGVVALVNPFLPSHRQLKTRKAPYTNFLVIAATNRADSLDPALLRPGRFDRRLAFELPSKASRRELVDHFLSRKAHAAELDDPDLREQLAAQTMGYSPVMLEHMLDEALVLALRHGRDAMCWADVQEARLTGEVGQRNPVEYTPAERRRVATHEAGHATVAWLSGTRRLEVLSIIKRKDSLGLLAHGDRHEVFTRTRGELLALIDISMGGLCAEETFFADVSTGPSGDLAYATQVACEVVGSTGMGGSLVSLAAVSAGAFNDTNLVGRVLSDSVTRPMVDELLTASKERAAALIHANRHLVEALRDALLEREELVGEQITAVLEAAGAARGTEVRIETAADQRRRPREG